MEIDKKDIESIKTIGNLNGEQVKMIKTFGGFHIAIGKKYAWDDDQEPLAAGSHQGIVLHEISKKYSEFEKAIQKSELTQIEKVKEYSQFLGKSEQNQGLELYSSELHGEIDIIVYQYGRVLGKYEGHCVDNKLELKKHQFNIQITPELVKSISDTIKEIMTEKRLDKVVFKK
jgi:hypothetical protein